MALPTIPAPVAVSVDPKTTAYLILDINSAVCKPRPVCTDTVPAIAGFLKKARAATMTVVYSTTANATVLPEVAPQASEQTVTARADKFIGTDLDGILKKAQAKTLVIVGSASNGAVLYTSFHGNALGYTVAVAEDGISAPEPFATFETRYQLLNQPGFANATNKALADKAVTLTRTDLITVK